MNDKEMFFFNVMKYQYQFPVLYRFPQLHIPTDFSSFPTIHSCPACNVWSMNYYFRLIEDWLLYETGSFLFSVGIFLLDMMIILHKLYCQQVPAFSYWQCFIYFVIKYVFLEDFKVDVTICYVEHQLFFWSGHRTFEKCCSKESPS